MAVALLALLAYTYLGYPIAIGLLARRRRWRPAARTDGAWPSVTICLPVHDGAAWLPAKLDSLLAQDYPGPVEILIYCDGCTDQTESIARERAGQPDAARVRVIAEARRLGKPSGLNALGAAATGELVLLNDVRQPLAPGAMRALAAALADPAVGCATGNLVVRGGAGSGVYWRYETWIRRQESAFRGMVGMTGPIAMLRRRDLAPLPPDLILDDVWIPMRIACAGRRTVFVPEAEAHDTAFADAQELRRKVRTLAGNYQLLARMPALLVPFANPIWFETFSHKLLRLLAPWLLLALAAVSAAGARDSAALAALSVAQLAFYAAAAAGPRLGRAGALARTFVVLNAAALLGLWRFLTGSQRITW